MEGQYKNTPLLPNFKPTINITIQEFLDFQQGKDSCYGLLGHDTM
jgi:hypothetical protein